MTAATAACCLTNIADRLAAFSGGHDLVAELFQRPGDHFTHCGLVIDQENQLALSAQQLRVDRLVRGPAPWAWREVQLKAGSFVLLALDPDKATVAPHDAEHG